MDPTGGDSVLDLSIESDLNTPLKFRYDYW